jgi:hypothetical protein
VILHYKTFYFGKTCAETWNFSLPKKLDLRKTELFRDRPSGFCSRYPNICDRTKKMDISLHLPIFLHWHLHHSILARLQISVSWCHLVTHLHWQLSTLLWKDTRRNRLKNCLRGCQRKIQAFLCPWILVSRRVSNYHQLIFPGSNKCVDSKFTGCDCVLVKNIMIP